MTHDTLVALKYALGLFLIAVVLIGIIIHLTIPKREGDQ